MKRKVFELPRHPRRGPQRIVVEKPQHDAVWYLVLDENKCKPLSTLKNPISAKQVLDEFGKIYGEDNVAQFVAQGFSLVNS